MPRADCDSGWGFSCPPDQTCHPFRQGYKCPDESCPMFETYVCNDGIRCFDDHQKCDGIERCKDGTDELNCPVKSSSHNVSLILPMVMGLFVVLMITICVCIVIYRRRRMASHRNAGMVILQPQGGQGNQTLNVQVAQPVYIHPGQQGPVIQQYQPTVPVQAQNPQGYQPVPMMPNQPSYQPGYQPGYQPHQQIQNPSAPPAYEEARHYPQK